MPNLFSSRGSWRKQTLSFFLFVKQNDAFRRVHPESHLGHSFDAAFFWFIYLDCQLSSSSSSQSLPVTDSLICIGCYFILASSLKLLRLWESYFTSLILVIYCHITNYPQTVVAQRTNTSYIIISVGQESAHVLAESSVSAVDWACGLI